ncbi:hypothetical protein RRG08_029821 [Elysia crispata]|uniref:Uncharacterized protein n=1 Tax=Elysia crispata TaxID=231223 RepID=A0AAE0YLX5_9GAST|nr:hypothetical protein RRG08_029821 [Elysia crispata]
MTYIQGSLSRIITYTQGDLPPNPNTNVTSTAKLQKVSFISHVTTLVQIEQKPRITSRVTRSTNNPRPNSENKNGSRRARDRRVTHVARLT